MPVPLIRTSERTGNFKRCPQKWKWSTLDGLTPLRDSNPLWFGQGIHIALAEWYQEGLKRGPHPAETWAEFCGDEERYIPTEYEENFVEFAKAKDLGIEMMTNYVDLYGTDPRWDVIATEQTFQQLIADPRVDRLPNGKRKALVRYVGTFDGVYRDTGNSQIWLMEHKTAASISTGHLALDEQAGSYWLFATKVLRKRGLIGPREQITGIMYNFMRKGFKDDRPTNERGEALNLNGSVSKRQPPPLFHREPVDRTVGEMKTMEERIQAEALHMELMRNGTLPIYKTPNKDCSWQCEFYRMCQMHEAGADWQEYRDEMFRYRDPYGDHRQNRKSA